MAATNAKRNKYKVVGTRPIRHDGADKVTGRAKYAADLPSANILFGKILRSPHAHARILSIDTSAAEKQEGVKATVTAKDLPKTKFGPNGERPVTSGDLGADLKRLRDGILASEKITFKGQAVAGIVALTAHEAEEAAKHIKVEYEVLDAVTDVRAAMSENAPILHEDLDMVEFGETTGIRNNIAEHFQHKAGDVEKGFAESDIVIEREFDTATVHQGYIEPHNCTVQWRDDGRIHIWNSTQGPFQVRDATAEILDVGITDVKLTPLEIGGGFGGKFEPYGEPIAALLSQKAGNKPVKISMSRSEEFECTGPTPGSYIKVKMGCKNDGTILAGTAYLAYEAGGFPGSPVAAAAECVFAPYNIPNFVVDGYDVVVNKPKTAAYRAPGATNAEFASETIIDEMAEKIGMDPIDFRLKNATSEGLRKVDGTKFASIGCVEVLEATKNHPHYSAPLKGKNKGRGVAIGYWMNAGLQSAVNIAVNGDGTINLTEGSPDIGGSRTSIAMQAAEILGIPAEDVYPSVVDTDSIGFTFGTGGSRTTFATGWAAIEAARDIKSQMIQRAALIWGEDTDSVEMVDGIIKSNKNEELVFSFKELAAELNGSGGPITGRGAVDPQGVGAAFGSLIVDTHVDPETGKVSIERVTSIQDAGTAIHPSYVEGQMQGGTAQGIGWALNEEYFMNSDGVMTNSTFLDYRVPTALDLPMIDTQIVEVPNPGHPLGVRGVGEVNIVPPPAAVANAIYRSVGIRMQQLPMHPGAIVETIRNTNGN